jgi:hypothetical protein
MRRGDADRTLIAAGLAAVALGALALLDRSGAVDLTFDYLLPAVLAAVGAVLLTAGLSE